MKHRAFTLIEMLVAVSIVLILMSAMITVTGHLKNEARRRLTASALGVIATALDQYYENYKKFPFNTQLDSNVPPKPLPYTLVDFCNEIGGTPLPVVKAGATLMLQWEEKDGSRDMSSAALFYFLDRDKTTRQILDALASTLVSNKEPINGGALTITITAGGVSQTFDLPRFIDAWGMSLRYVYMDGYAFPVITSAGPDKIFGTEDDVVGQ